MLWQGSAVVLLAAAGAMAGIPQVRSWLAPGQPAKPPIEVVVPGPTPTQSQPQLSIAAAAQSLNHLTTWTPPPPAPKVEVAEVQEAPKAPPPPPSEWTYIGSIITPTIRSALVKVDNAQQILRVGTSYNNVKLVTVEADFIEIEKGEARERIELAGRTLLAPTEQPKRPVAFRSGPAPAPGAAAMATGAPMAMGRPPGPGATAPGPATFDQARMAAEQARMAALAQREAARGGAVANPPPREDLNIQEQNREAAVKALSDPSIAPEDRVKILGQMGITPSMTPEMVMEVGKKHGLEISKDTLEILQKYSKESDGKESK